MRNTDIAEEGREGWREPQRREVHIDSGGSGKEAVGGKQSKQVEEVKTNERKGN